MTDKKRELVLTTAMSQHLTSLWSNILEALNEADEQKEKVEQPAAFKIHALVDGSLHLEPFSIPDGIVMVQQGPPETPLQRQPAQPQWNPGHAQPVQEPRTEPAAAAPVVDPDIDKRRTVHFSGDNATHVSPSKENDG